MKPGCGWPGPLHWLRTATSALFTDWCCHTKRGKDGIDAAGVVSGFTGIVVHDAFAPYARYPAATHGPRNAHLLRELTAVAGHHHAHAAAARSAVPAGWVLMR